MFFVKNAKFHHFLTIIESRLLIFSKIYAILYKIKLDLSSEKDRGRMDELLTYLHNKKPDNIIIEDDDCNLLLFGDSSTRPTTLKALLFVIGCEANISQGTVREMRNMYRASSRFRQLYNHGVRLAELAGLPFIMVAYKKCAREEIKNVDLDAMLFCVAARYPSKEDFQILESAAFVKCLYRTFGMRYRDEGTHKPENKSLADVFHVWSRTKLSSHIIKQDLDAIYCNDQGYSMIEIKRSPVRTLEQWAPYRDDSSNYDIQNQFAKAINASFFTFHYNGGECTDETRVGCYTIFNVDLSNYRKWIDYEKKIIQAQEIFKVLDNE